MELDRITVEVRDRYLVRQGQITHKWLQFKATIPHNGVGTWELTLPKSHPMAELLMQPGSGIVMSIDGNEKLSGPTDQPTHVINKDNPDGTYTFTGISDDVLLADALAYPSPGVLDPGAQTAANDVRNATSEDLLRQYVSYNICAGIAPAGRTNGTLRQYLRLDPINLHRGVVQQKSPRFQNLGELLGEIATLASLGFRVIQRDQDLVFEVYAVHDASATVQLSVENGSLTSQSLALSAPQLTRAIVAGQGEGTERQIIERTTADSLSAESAWGRRIEEFIDQRNTDVIAELEQKGDEVLADKGFTATNVKAIPADDQTMKYNLDWAEGDTVGVITFGQLTRAVVSAATIIVNKDAVAVGAAIGDVSGFNASAATAKQVDDNQRRISNLERSVEQSGTIPWTDVTGTPTTYPPSAHTHTVSQITDAATIAVPVGTILPLAGNNLPSGGWLLCQGQAVSRTTYATLYAQLGTAFGAGDGSTTFNLPDLQGRSIFGLATANSNFNSRGKKGGTETETLTVAQMPSHSHNFLYAGNGQQYAGFPYGAVGTTAGGLKFFVGSDSYSNVSIAANGGGGSHNNLPPYMALNFIIKT